MSSHSTPIRPKRQSMVKSSSAQRVSMPRNSIPRSRSSIIPQESPKKRERPSSAPSPGQAESNIKVVVRCRARNEREVAENTGVALTTAGLNGKEIQAQQNQYSTKTFAYDRVFGAESDQRMVYEEVATNALEEVLTGYNCTIFAYGQTGTGKTYTMTGDLEDSKDSKPAENAGIIPRVLFDLFKHLNSPEYANTEHSVKTSYIELYNEELRDLVSPRDDNKIKIYDDVNNKGSVVLQGMDEAFLKEYSQGLDVLRHGAMKRQTATTKCNDMSSRSHSVFTITLHLKETTQGGEEFVRVGKLNLVDLAGSENINRSGADKKNAREAGMINQSLLTLGRVINSLVEHSAHVPYRESKLTRILRDSLGGRTKTCIVATVTPAKGALDETLSTLEYANRAQSIKNQPQANQTKSKQAQFTEFVEEIERLRADLNAAREQTGVYLAQESYDALVQESESRRISVEEKQLRLDTVEEQLKTLRDERESYAKEMKAMEDKVETVEKELANRQLELQNVRGELKETQSQLKTTNQELDKERALKEALEAHRVTLTQIGNSLIDKLGEVTSDVDKLQTKIGRDVVTNGKNCGTIEALKSDVSESMTELDQFVQDFAFEFGMVKDGLQNQVGNVARKHKTQVEELTANLDTFTKSLKTHNDELSSFSGSAHEALVGELQKIDHAKEELKTRVAGGFTALEKQFQCEMDSVTATVSELDDELASKFDGIRQNITKFMDGVCDELATQSAQINDLKSFVSSHQTKVGGLLDNHVTFVDQATAKSKADGRERGEQFLKDVAALFEKYDQHRDGDLNNFAATIQQGYKKMKTQLDADCDGLTTVTDKISSHNNNVKTMAAPEFGNTNLGALQTEIKETRSVVSEKLQNQVSQFNENVNVLDTDCINQATQYHEAVSQHVSKMDTRIDSLTLTDLDLNLGLDLSFTVVEKHVDNVEQTTQIVKKVVDKACGISTTEDPHKTYDYIKQLPPWETREVLGPIDVNSVREEVASK